MAIINFLERHPQLLNIVAAIYTFIHRGLPLSPVRGCTIVRKGAFLEKCELNIIGGGNKIIINPLARIRNCSFTIIGDNCTIEIGGRDTVVHEASFWCQQKGSSIIIGHDFMMGRGSAIAAMEGKSVKIGDDCMFSDDIDIRNGDSHGIYSSEDGRRLNYAKDIIIGDHVWITAHARLLKGVVIPSHSIVGNSAVVSSSFQEEHAVYAGVPAKKVKSGIEWKKKVADDLKNISRARE